MNCIENYKGKLTGSCSGDQKVRVIPNFIELGLFIDRGELGIFQMSKLKIEW